MSKPADGADTRRYKETQCPLCLQLHASQFLDPMFMIWRGDCHVCGYEWEEGVRSYKEGA